MSNLGNYRFDIPKWLKRNLPLTVSYCGEEETLSGTYCQTPCGICQNLHLRRMLTPYIDWGRSVPIDLFVMAEGEPKRRHNTKFGGVPYRPRGLPWPEGPNFGSATFLAQFCFYDSRDIFGKLPGDVLLIFTDAQDDWPDDFIFEWYPLGLTDLMRASEVPKQRWEFKPSHGYICRIDGYPEPRMITEPDGLERIMIGENTYINLDYFSFDKICWGGATQIGPWSPNANVECRDPPHKPLCLLSHGLQFSMGPWPWPNREEPLFNSEREWLSTAAGNYREYFSWCDDGEIFISIDDDLNVYGNLGQR